ncbi:MAG: GNAT family N-acetyltransferase [Tannerella sp.]|jgi:GNAT superfamily N-acetyltransferase|nr:GNAT family N-acetyltransferase [Tannerella sp.]
MITTEMETVTCNFADPAHRQAIGDLINTYIADDMGGGTRLSGQQQLCLADSLQKRPQTIVLLAGCGGVWCGLLVAFENFSTFAVQPMINIHDLVVRKEYRRQGVGQRLMNALVVEAERRKCSRITLEVRQDNLAAQRLYKAMGFDDTEPPMFYWRKEMNTQNSPVI